MKKIVLIKNKVVNLLKGNRDASILGAYKFSEKTPYKVGKLPILAYDLDDNENETFNENYNDLSKEPVKRLKRW